MSYLWSPAELVTNPLAQNTFASPSVNTTFTVQIANVCGVGVDSVSVELIAPTRMRRVEVGCAVGKPWS